MLVSLNNKIKANAAINAKLHVSLLDSCSLLDSLRNSDHRTSHHTQNHLIQEHYSVHGRIMRALWHEPTEITEWSLYKYQLFKKAGGRFSPIIVFFLYALTSVEEIRRGLVNKCKNVVNCVN